MRAVKIMGAVLAIAAVGPNASLAEPARPALSPGQLNCADTNATGDARLSQSEARRIARSLARTWQARASRPGWAHSRRLDAYTLAFCRTSAGGPPIIIVDGLYSALGASLCDDAEGFAVTYDPRSGRFGDFAFGVSACAAGSRQPQD
ncbi:hypothetical protein ACO2Q3_18255 [Caulobacter sp. KR2-114]|uniref:hypothetical protein n=1 Tax=Caulobacter sp. KR2-114 TaxID=3400912 RepID=UPI003C065A80